MECILYGNAQVGATCVHCKMGMGVLLNEPKDWKLVLNWNPLTKIFPTIGQIYHEECHTFTLLHPSNFTNI
jgi:hypothetical protein